MTGKIELVNLEKTSSLVRNIIIIFTAVFTGAFFLSDRFGKDLMVRVETLYLNGENTLITTPELHDSKKLTGRLGTISKISIKNKTDLPVVIEVRIPKPYQTNNEDEWPLFTTISARSTCHLKKDEIKISNNGVLEGNIVGSVDLSKLPPECTLSLTIASSQIDEATRFMSGRVNVFYDGKKASIDSPTKVYGSLGNYIYKIQRRGVGGVLLYVLFPLLFILFFITWVMVKLPSSISSKTEEKPITET